MVKYYDVTLVDQRILAKDTIAFWFDTNGASFEFRAGQHADFVFAHPSIGHQSDNSRTFSFASSPRHKGPIAMRMCKTDFKTTLMAAAPGTKFIVSRPRGVFTLHKDISRPAVFLAGGMGITPIRSIIQQVAQERLPQTVSVLFKQGSGRSPIHGGIRRYDRTTP